MSTKSIDLLNLTPEQMADLMKQMQQIAAEKKESERRERESYRTIVNQTVAEQYRKLEQISSTLSIVKADVYRQFAAVIELKQELYGAKSKQQSHTFTDDEGRSITIGWRTIDSFNDTLDMGIALIRDYITTLAIDENTSQLVDMINQLLKKDAKGNLKPSRILDLRNMAEKIDNETFSKGVDIVIQSYTPARSVIFVEASSTDAQQVKQPVALSITSAPFPDGYAPNFGVFQ
jgi:hypothetical protein